MPAPDPAASAGPALSAPRIVGAIGLHASASTWVFNIARGLWSAALGEASVSALYADRTSELPAAPAAHLLIKSHHGSAELDDWLKSRTATLLLSIRDPRDAALSMAQRFEAPLQHTAIWLRNDCNRLLNVLPDSHLLLKYEDRFFDDPASLDKIAKCLGLTVDRDVAARLFDQYRTEAVRSFAARIPQLPRERIAMIGKFQMDEVTQNSGPAYRRCAQRKMARASCADATADDANLPAIPGALRLPSNLTAQLSHGAAQKTDGLSIMTSDTAEETSFSSWRRFLAGVYEIADAGADSADPEVEFFARASSRFVLAASSAPSHRLTRSVEAIARGQGDGVAIRLQIAGETRGLMGERTVEIRAGDVRLRRPATPNSPSSVRRYSPKGSRPVRVTTAVRRPSRAAATATLEGEPPRNFPNELTFASDTPVCKG